MRKLIKRYIWPAILALAGLGADMIPQITSWVPSVILWSLAALLFIIMTVDWVRHRKEPSQTKEVRTKDVTVVLTDMHQRMIQLKNQRLSMSKKIDLTKLDNVGAILMDRLGLVELDKWDNFQKKLQKRILRSVPKRRQGNWHFKMLAKASEIKRELLGSKEWSINDALTISEWLEEQHLGVRALRDKDELWNKLFESINPHLTNQELRPLIEKHINVSYIGCTMLLISAYSRRQQNSFLLPLLQSILIGSPFDPVKIDLALSEVIADIQERLA